MKSNESQATVVKRNSVLVDKRGRYKGIPYAILYQAPRGYFARILDKSFSKILSLRYFDDRDEAEAHLERELDGYMRNLKDKAKKENSKTFLEKFKYKGLDCVMRTVAYPATKLQPQERYSHVAICDELGIRTKPHDTHRAAMQELKKLVDESIKDRDNKKGNSMTKNNAKKIAILKSNAAPEVKLKALEKLDSMTTLKNEDPKIKDLKRGAIMQWTACNSYAQQISDQCEKLIDTVRKAPWQADDLIRSTNDAKKCLASLKQADRAVGDF